MAVIRRTVGCKAGGFDLSGPPQRQHELPGARVGGEAEVGRLGASIAQASPQRQHELASARVGGEAEIEVVQGVAQRQVAARAAVELPPEG